MGMLTSLRAYIVMIDTLHGCPAPSLSFSDELAQPRGSSALKAGPGQQGGGWLGWKFEIDNVDFVLQAFHDSKTYFTQNMFGQYCAILVFSSCRTDVDVNIILESTC